MSDNNIDATYKVEKKKERFSTTVNGIDIQFELTTPIITVKQITSDKANFDYCDFVCKWIYNGIVNGQKENLTLDEIKKQSTAFFENIFSKFLEHDATWKRLYDSIDTSCDIKQRFIDSYIKSLREKMMQSIDIQKDFLSEFSKTIAEMNQAILGVWEKNFAVIDNIVSSIRDSFRDISSAAIKSLASIKIPTISEKRKRELVKSYSLWGDYGWTPHPRAPISYYNDCPDTYIEADKYAMKLCTNENMLGLFDILRTQNVPQKDLEEAVLCYKNKYYKACAMVLYSIIDGKFIRWQKKNNKQNLKTCGTNSIVDFKKMFEKNTNVNDTVFFLLDYTCTYKCLNKYFEKAQNFQLVTNVANRNLVDHGMAKKPVRKKDCVKLFLLLYNLGILFEKI